MSLAWSADHRLIKRLHGRLRQAARFRRGLARPGRWLAWAQSRIDRGLTQPAVIRRLAMRLVSPGADASVWTYSPVIHLHVNPVVRQYLTAQVARQGSTGRPPSGDDAPRAVYRAALPPIPGSPPARAHEDRPTFRYLASHPATGAKKPQGEGQPPGMGYPTRAAEARSVTRSARPPQPIQRVFLRQEITEQQPGMITIQVQQVERLAAGASTAERVTLRLRRVEEPSQSLATAAPSVGTPAAPVKKVVVHAGVPRSQPAPEAASEAGWPQSGGSPPGSKRPQPRRPGQEVFPPPAPSIDIQQITDQVVRTIDRRILAQRERTGRLF